MGSCLYSGAFERYQGYMAAMHMNGLEARREWVSFEADNDYEISLLPEAQRILDKMCIRDRCRYGQNAGGSR